MGRRRLSPAVAAPASVPVRWRRRVRALAAALTLAALAAAAPAPAQTDRLQGIGNDLDPTCQSAEQSVNSQTQSEVAKDTYGTAVGALNANIPSVPLVGKPSETPPKSDLPCDNSYTPVIKSSSPEVEKWKQIAGALYAEEGPIRYAKSSVVPYDVNFQTVSLRNTKLGMIAGTRCAKSPPEEFLVAEPTEEQSEALESYVESKECVRVPTIYRYTDKDTEGPILREIYRSDTPGYIAQIAWLDDQTALAIGGTGHFVEREAPIETDEDGDGDRDEADWVLRDLREGAGMARAWLYTTDPKTKIGSWREYTDAEIPDQMRGLSALGIQSSQLAYVGALRQIWEWTRADGFAQKGFTDDPSSLPIEGRESFHFRVRAIVGGTAYTGGCCASQAVNNFPRSLGRSVDAEGEVRWSISPRDPDPPFFEPIRPLSVTSLGPGVSIISPDGPVPPPQSPLSPEPPSFVFSNQDQGDIVEWTRSNSTGLTGIRPPVRIDSTLFERRRFTSPAFRLLSVDTGWSVGTLPSGQALVQAGDTPGRTLFVEDTIGESKLYRLSSHALNGVDAIPGFDITWAVGDHGAILRRGHEGALQSQEPEPPRLGNKGAEKLSDTEALHREGTSAPEDVGSVPAFDEMPIKRLEEPEWVHASLPGVDKPISSIVMSRDGSEGWAFTADASGGYLYHFGGVIWERCDPNGKPAFDIPPDPECAGVRPDLLAVARIPYEHDANPTNDDRFEIVGLEAAPRHSSGAHEGLSGALWRYNGVEQRWRREVPRRPPSDALSGRGPFTLAFTSPTEGWAVAGTRGFGTSLSEKPMRQHPLIYRFSEGQWKNCAPSLQAGNGTPLVSDRFTPRTKCADWNDLLPYADLESAKAPGVTAVGERVYLYGTRSVANAQGNADPLGRRWPMLLYRDPGPCTQTVRTGCWQQALDPGCEPGPSGSPPNPATQSTSCIGFSEDPADRGSISGATIVWGPDGYEGWLRGSPLLRMLPDGSFKPWAEPAGTPLSDYGMSAQMIGFPGSDGEPRYILQASGGGRGGQGTTSGPLLQIGPEDNRWEILPGPWGPASAPNTALAPDQSGGFFFGGKASSATPAIFHYTDEAPRAVFTDAPHPIEQRISAIAGSADGTLWVATRSNVLYRHDRVGGWERVQIPGWDPGRIQALGSPINAIAGAPDGSGIAVGPGGRIADISADSVRLDPAAGTSCARLGANVPPCGTSRNLASAALAPDGSALLGGAGRALLFRPANGEFRAARTPETSNTATFASISYPTTDRAYLATDSGQIYSGDRSGDSWSWTLENTDENGSLITRVDELKNRSLKQIAVNEEGHGYAVATDGTLYERIGEGHGSHAWREIPAPFPVQTLAIPEGRGEGVLLGGERGIVATGEGEDFSLARVPDPYDPLTDNNIGASAFGSATVGLALLPGSEPGEVEAWAALRGGDARNPGDVRNPLLHFASDSADPLLDHTLRATALTDTPRPRPGEISFAAFGKSDCPVLPTKWHPCPELLGSNERSQIATMRVADEIAERSEREGGPDFALFTGDQNDGAQTGGVLVPRSTTEPSLNHHRWRDLVARPLIEAGVPIFGAIGGQDRDTFEKCGILPNPTACEGTRPYKLGTNIAWREAMAELPVPWGGGPEAESGGLRFEAIPDSTATETQEDLRRQGLTGGKVDEARDAAFGASELLPPHDPLSVGIADSTLNLPYNQARAIALNELGTADRTLPREDAILAASIGGARTHYAFDVVDSETEEKLARVAVVDTSLRSLSASDAQQNPIEAQAGWLEEILCVRDAAGEVRGCTREPDQPAIVLSNAPTYSYGPGYVQNDPGRFYTNAFSGAVEGVETQLDATAFEALLLKNDVSVVVSGRIGWNALYWATAPGVHEPCPGGNYPNPYDPPRPGARLCGQSSSSVPDPSDPGGAALTLTEALRKGGAPVPEEADDLAGKSPEAPAAIPFVISSSAGGKLADLNGPASNGFWSGYAIVRVAANGDPSQTIVEQRPIFDWTTITASEHTVFPGQRVDLRGLGREAIGLDASSGFAASFRYDEIETPAITHRYALVEADPERPWIPTLEEGADAPESGEAAITDDPAGCGPYVCLDPKLGTIDDQTGEIKAGNGKYPDTFAIALLSVGDHSATWPLVFKRSPSFVVNPVVGQTQIPSVPAGSESAPQPPPPPSPAQPGMPPTSAPAIPVPPPLAPLSSGEAPEPQPPTPPAPPPPSEQPSPFNLALAPPSITLATPTAVIQPPTPPVNPAPPGGARREARQRQAATQKSGADGDMSEGAESTRGAGGDFVQGTHGPAGAEMRRRDRTRPEPSITALARPEQPSAWSQGALYGGAVGLMALVAAIGFTHARPTPRRRPPEVPAPAHARAWRRPR